MFTCAILLKRYLLNNEIIKLNLKLNILDFYCFKCMKSMKNAVCCHFCDDPGQYMLKTRKSLMCLKMNARNNIGISN